MLRFSYKIQFELCARVYTPNSYGIVASSKYHQMEMGKEAGGQAGEERNKSIASKSWITWSHLRSYFHTPFDNVIEEIMSRFFVVFHQWALGRTIAQTFFFAKITYFLKQNAALTRALTRMREAKKKKKKNVCTIRQHRIFVLRPSVGCVLAYANDAISCFCLVFLCVCVFLALFSIDTCDRITTVNCAHCMHNAITFEHTRKEFEWRISCSLCVFFCSLSCISLSLSPFLTRIVSFLFFPFLHNPEPNIHT